MNIKKFLKFVIVFFFLLIKILVIIKLLIEFKFFVNKIVDKKKI